MARAVTIGNGNLLVGLDYRGQVRDFYFPWVGHANHVSGASGSYTHRVGVWVDGTLRWLSDPSWSITIGSEEASALGVTRAHNSELGIALTITDAVHNEKNIFLRHVHVVNERDETRDIRVFFGQEFRISESRRGDTAFYDPRVHAIIHYKGHNAFLINATVNGRAFTEYSVGLFDIEGRSGTHADAEDGVLSKNPIEHGSTDSVIGVAVNAPGGEAIDIHYWIAAGQTIPEAHTLNDYVMQESPQRLIASVGNYWNAWLEKESFDLSHIEPDMQRLYKQSLLILRTHTDNRGGIIASSDTDVLNQGRDTYSYVWPRDAAFIANALDRTGYTDPTERFFEFMAKNLEHDGYLMHKYRVDGVLGSSWHPWVRDGRAELPIQEDETAAVLYMLGEHYAYSKNLEFIESLYNPFIEPAANFMCGHIEPHTGLPASSYDLWEEKYGSSTYTAAAVYGALQVAAEVSALLGKRANAERYRTTAATIKKGILGYLYDANLGMFVKLVHHVNHDLKYDRTLDMSSFYGVVKYGVLDTHDQKVIRARDVVLSKLTARGPHGGLIRYENDRYYAASQSADPNAWCITTLWMAQYYVKAAATKDDLRPARELMAWVTQNASRSGILPEQIDSYTGAHLSTAPLVWSHAEYVTTIDEYRKKYASLSK